jgi:hypothetical protein
MGLVFAREVGRCDVGGNLSVQFAFHDDHGYANNPLGALIQWVTDVLGHNKRQPCQGESRDCMNSLRSILWLMTFAILSTVGHLSIQAQAIQVRVLDARSGGRISNERVSVSVKGEKGSRAYKTDSEGNFSLQIDPSAYVYVATEWRVTCTHITHGIVPFIPVATIMQEGFTDENTCGRAKSETIKGKLIIFSRKASFSENFRR